MLNLIISLILGWLLGILSPGIIERISAQYKKNLLLQVIISDLKDVKKRLMLLPLTINPSYGNINKELVIWLKTQTLDSSDLEISDELKSFLKSLDAENDDNLSSFINQLNLYNKRNNPAFHFKKMVMSIVDSNLINISLLNENFLAKLLEIKFQINAFNEEIDNLNKLLFMTFDSSISHENHQILKAQIDKNNLLISKKAVYIVDKINALIESENKK